MKALNKIAAGEYFKRKPSAKVVYIKGAYDRTSKSFECSDTEDMNRTIWIKASALVCISFDY